MKFLYKTEPLAHQKEVVERTSHLKNYALFWEMGLGKSKAIIDTCTALFLDGKINGAILISDKGNYLNWKKEIATHSALPGRVYVYASGKKTRFIVTKPTDMDYLLVNTEALSSSKSVEACIQEFCRTRRVLGCIDEATSIKGHNSLRSKNAFALGTKWAYRRILTGTPLCQSLLDIFGQFRFLDPQVFGVAYYPFRAKYAVLEEQYLPGGKTFKKVVGYRNSEEMKERLRPHCSRLTKEDCLDLPEKIYVTRMVEHTKEQARIHKDLVDFAVTSLASGVIATAASALSLVNRMRQLNLGRVTSDDAVLYKVPHKRLDALDRVLEEHDGKAIIWCAFQKDVLDVLDALGDAAVAYYGPMSIQERNRALESFLSDPGIKYFVATPDTAGKSLTLVVANLVIYYSNGFKLENRLQSEDRAHRYGQKKSVTYVDLVCPGTVDEEILANLQGKKEMADSILTSLKNITLRSGASEAQVSG